MKIIIYSILLFLLSYSSYGCNEYCFSNMYYSSFKTSDLIIIAKIDSLIIEKETNTTGKYTAVLNKESTLVIKGKLNKPLVGKYDFSFICGSSYTPLLNKTRIIYAKLVNNEYVFHETKCSRNSQYLDDLEDYTLLKDSKNFKWYLNSNSELNDRNRALHLLLNNIQLTKKTYNSFYRVLPSKETSKKLNEIKVPKNQYSFYEVSFKSNGSIKKIKCLKKIDKSTDKKIRNIIKDGSWKVKINHYKPDTKKDFVRLFKFDNFSKASIGHYPNKPRIIRGRIIQEYK